MIKVIVHYWQSKKFQYQLFILIVISSMLYLNIPASMALTAVIVLWMPEIIYPLLIVVPAIKNVSVIFQGFTMIKLVGLLYIINFFKRKIRKDIFNFRIIARDPFVIFVCLFLLVIIINILNFRIFSWEIVSTFFETNFFSIIKENLAWCLTIIFSLFLFYDFATMKLKEIEKNLRNISIAAGPIILILFFYTMFSGLVRWETYHVIRSSLLGTKPGEYSYLLSVMIPFLIYSIIYYRNAIVRIISVTSLLAIIYIVSITISRGGALTLIFTFGISIILLNKEFKNILLFSGIIIGLVGFLILTGVINVDYWIIRNKVMSGNLSQFTTHRYDFLIAGLEYSFSNIKNFIFGGGSSVLIDRTINLMNYGRNHVMHNIYIGILVRYGIVGLAIFVFMMGRLVFGISEIRSYLIEHKQAIFLVPFISLSVPLFAGLFVSWEFREILWILAGICAGLLHSLHNSNRDKVDKDF